MFSFTAPLLSTFVLNPLCLTLLFDKLPFSFIYTLCFHFDSPLCYSYSRMSTCSADVSTAFMLQNGIANMFQNVRDANNQPVNPLPISIECVRLYGHRQPDTQVRLPSPSFTSDGQNFDILNHSQHYAFMGISLIQFAASSYLRQRFNQCKDATLFQLQKALMQRQNLQKTIGEMFNIPSDTMDVATIVEGILG